MKLAKLFLRSVWWIYVAITGAIAFAIGLVGIGAGIYVGGWVMLLGGFADFINLFKTPDPVTAADIAISLAKIIFAIPVGFIISSTILIPAREISETWKNKPEFAKNKDIDVGSDDGKIQKT